MRGLESTCTFPWDSRKVSNAAKLGVCSASPNTAPAGFEAAAAPAELTMLRLAVSATSSLAAAAPPTAALLESWPAAMRRLKIAQLIPAWYSPDNVTSMIFASSITWRSIDRRVARRYCSTARSCCGKARTTTTPDCGVTMTERPSPVPTMASSAVRKSAQRSDCCWVVTRLVSSARLELVGAEPAADARHARHSHQHRRQQRAIQRFRARRGLALRGARELGRNRRQDALRWRRCSAAGDQRERDRRGRELHRSVCSWAAGARRIGFFSMCGYILSTSRWPFFRSTAEDSVTSTSLPSCHTPPTGTATPSMSANLRPGEVSTPCNLLAAGAPACCAASSRASKGRIGSAEDCAGDCASATPAIAKERNTTQAADLVFSIAHLHAYTAMISFFWVSYVASKDRCVLRVRTTKVSLTSGYSSTCNSTLPQRSGAGRLSSSVRYCTRSKYEPLKLTSTPWRKTSLLPCDPSGLPGVEPAVPGVGSGVLESNRSDSSLIRLLLPSICLSSTGSSSGATNARCLAARVFSVSLILRSSSAIASSSGCRPWGWLSFRINCSCSRTDLSWLWSRVTRSVSRFWLTSARSIRVTCAVTTTTRTTDPNSMARSRRLMSSIRAIQDFQSKLISLPHRPLTKAQTRR